MKTKLIAILTLSALVLTSCSSNDKKGVIVDEKIEAAFTTKFAERKIVNNHVEWDIEFKFGKKLYEAEFYEEIKGKTYEVEAYFTEDAKWEYNKIEISREKLNDPIIPQEVKDAISKMPEADWHVDDVDLYEFSKNEDLFVIELEKGIVEKHYVLNKAGKISDFPYTVNWTN